MDAQIDIKAIRISRGESQAEFAKYLNVDQATIHRWETKGVPSGSVFRVGLEQFLAALPKKGEAA